LSNFLQLAFLLVIILVAAKASGYLATRLGQPSVLGELLVGLLLGPSLVDIVHLPFITNLHLGETIHELGELGVLLLMFIAGLELHLSELAKNTRVAAYAGALGVFVPVALGVLAGELFGLSLENSIFLGLTLGATSVSISAQTLMELKVLRSRVGLGLLGAAVFDDILVILFLSSFVALAAGGSAAQVVVVLIRMIGFLVLSAAFGLWVLPRLTVAISKMHFSQNVLTFAIVIMLTYGLAAELLGGMAAITGAFLAGLMLARTHEKERIESGMHALAYGLFVPIFFVNIGLSIDLREFQLQALFFTVVIILVAVAGKWLGSGWGARLGGLSQHESIQLGAGMISRGEVGLIVASVGVYDNLVSAEEFSAIVVMVLVTTLITPPILRALFSQKDAKAEKMQLEAEQVPPKGDAKKSEVS